MKYKMTCQEKMVECFCQTEKNSKIKKKLHHVNVWKEKLHE